MQSAFFTLASGKVSRFDCFKFFSDDKEMFLFRKHTQVEVLETRKKSDKNT